MCAISSSYLFCEMYWSFENRNYPLQTDKRKRHIDQIVRSLMIVFYLKKLMRCLAAIIRSSFSFGRILFNFLYERDMEGFQFPTTIKLSYTNSKDGNSIDSHKQ